MNRAIGDIARKDYLLISAIQQGLPLAPRPYRLIGERIGMTEHEVITRIEGMLNDGLIKRLGVVVRHHELGYHANGMVVWDVPEERVEEVGRCISQFEFITLCYRRQRVLPDWPYNLYCMIHGHNREQVRQQLDELITCCGFDEFRHEVLFSQRRFKQRGACYLHQQTPVDRGTTGTDVKGHSCGRG